MCGQIEPGRHLSLAHLLGGLVAVLLAAAPLRHVEVGTTLVDVVLPDTGDYTLVVAGRFGVEAMKSKIQAEFGETYGAIRPMIDGGGRFVAVSSAAPGAFEMLYKGRAL